MTGKRSPIHESALQMGAAPAARDGWLMPATFGRAGDGLPAIALVDHSHEGHIAVDGPAAEELLRSRGIEPPAAIGAGRLSDRLAVYRLRRDRFFVFTAPAEVEAVLASLRSPLEAEGRAVVTDLTHGRARLQLVGPTAAELLARVCALDFHSTRFPDWSIRGAQVANTTQLIIRQDMATNAGTLLPAYALTGARSLGAYLWAVLLKTGHDLDTRPLGIDDADLLIRG